MQYLLNLLDLILPRKSKYYVAAFALLGTLFSLAPLVIQWANYTSPIYAFENSFVVDKFSIILKGLFILITYLTFLLSINFIESDKYYQGEYYYLLLSSLLGALIVSSSRDLLTIFIGIELASTPMFLLSGWKKGDRKSNEGAIKFFLLGVLSASLILYGFSLLYGLSGELVFSNIASYLLSASLASSPVVLLSAILVISGIGFKISIVPFHSWAPDTYEGAPLPITAYLSVSSKATGFVALIILLTKVFAGSGSSWGIILVIISGLTMTLGDYQDGIFASVTYLIIYAFMNLGAFLSVHLFSNYAGSSDFYEWGGVARKSPLAGVLTTIFFFSLAGIPPLGGWFAKFVVFRSLLGSANSIGIALGVVGAINAVIALVYYARISKVIWMDELKSVNEDKIFQFENPLKVVGIFTVLITFVSGIFPGIFSYLGEVSSIFFGN